MSDVFEAHLRAAQSSDLTPLEGRCDVDRLTAAGFVAQNHPLGIALYKAKYQGDTDHTAYILHEVYMVARRYMERNRIKGRALDVAREVLVWFIDDIACPHCQGRKLMLIPDTNRLSAKPCAHCAGTGKLPLAGDAYEARRHVALQLEILIDAVKSALQRADR